METKTIKLKGTGTITDILDLAYEQFDDAHKVDWILKIAVWVSDKNDLLMEKKKWNG